MSNFSKWHLTHEILAVFSQFDIYFLGLPWEIFFVFTIWHLFSWAAMRNFLWCYYRWLITYLGIENVKKECNMCSIILVQGFCPLKIKITQFLMDSVLIIVTSTYSSNFLSVDKIVRWPLNGHKHGECFHTAMFNYSVWYRPNSCK